MMRLQHTKCKNRLLVHFVCDFILGLLFWVGYYQNSIDENHNSWLDCSTVWLVVCFPHSVLEKVKWTWVPCWKIILHSKMNPVLGFFSLINSCLWRSGFFCLERKYQEGREWRLFLSGEQKIFMTLPYLLSAQSVRLQWQTGLGWSWIWPCSQ